MTAKGHKKIRKIHQKNVCKATKKHKKTVSANAHAGKVIFSMKNDPRRDPRGVLEASWAPLGPLLDASWRLLGTLGSLLGASWEPLGSLLGASWHHRGSQELPKAFQEGPKRPPRAPRRSSRGPQEAAKIPPMSSREYPQRHPTQL